MHGLERSSSWAEVSSSWVVVFLVFGVGVLRDARTKRKREQQGCEVLLDVKERGADDSKGNVSKVSASVLRETVESAPKERRNYPASHADLSAVEVKLNGTSRMWVAASWLARKARESANVACS